MIGNLARFFQGTSIAFFLDQPWDEVARWFANAEKIARTEARG